jgi:hypothetical protein
LKTRDYADLSDNQKRFAKCFSPLAIREVKSRKAQEKEKGERQ